MVVWVSEGYDEACALDCADPRGEEFPVFAFYADYWEKSLTKVSDSFVEAFENHFGVR